MAKKKEEEEVEVVEQPKKRRKSTKKKEAPEEVVDNKNDNPPEVKSESKQRVLGILIDLIEGLEDKDNLLNRLIDSGYYRDYQKELRYKELGYDIAPYVDVNEFYKKIGKK